MDGVELINEIRKENSDVSIIVISSVANSTILQLLKKDHQLDYLKKPFNSAQIKAILDKVVHLQS